MNAGACGALRPAPALERLIGSFAIDNSQQVSGADEWGSQRSLPPRISARGEHADFVVARGCGFRNRRKHWGRAGHCDRSLFSS